MCIFIPPSSFSFILLSPPFSPSSPLLPPSSLSFILLSPPFSPSPPLFLFFFPLPPPSRLLLSPQVQLQNMMTSKFVGYFLEEVSDWQKKLATADSVITIWFEVQRTWSHLESIFIGSEDIRAQLPTHSKQFDTIDTDFKVRLQTDVLYDTILQSYTRKYHKSVSLGVQYECSNIKCQGQQVSNIFLQYSLIV